MPDNDDQLVTDAALLQQAERVCKERLKKTPDNRGVLRSLAEIYRKLGKLAEAAAAYERLGQLDPEDPEARYMREIFASGERTPAPTGTRASPFVLLNNFLPPEFHNALLPLFTSLQDKFITVLCARPGGLPDVYNPDARETLEYDKEWEGEKDFRRHLARSIKMVTRQLYLPPFKAEELEVQVRAYQDGHFFKAHHDACQILGKLTRVINYVYFFHKQPRPYSGGELLLYDSDPDVLSFTTSRFTRVPPAANSIVFFPACFFHSVVPIRCPSKAFDDSRFVINGHFSKQSENPPATDGTEKLEGATAAQ